MPHFRGDQQPTLHHYYDVHLIMMQPMVSLFPASSGVMEQTPPTPQTKGKIGKAKGDRMAMGAANERKRKNQEVGKAHSIHIHVL
jgi:hypothetical protein